MDLWSGGFQLWGAAESGKTTAGMVAGSVWGCHRDDGKREKGFAETWHTTPGKVEVTALAHNNIVLILDETKRAGRDGPSACGGSPRCGNWPSRTHGEGAAHQYRSNAILALVFPQHIKSFAEGAMPAGGPFH